MFNNIKKSISDFFIRWLTEDRRPEGMPLCDFERIRYEIRPGDVLLIEGRSRVSDIIRAITQSSWSHSALYVGRLHDIEDPKIRNLVVSHFNGSPDTQLIIEGLMGQGTVIMPLSSYAKDHIRLCRPRGLSRQDAQHVIAYAVRKLGQDYNVRQIFDLARFLLPWTLFPRRYRSILFESHAGESTKTVCSSMMAEAFASVDFPILPLVQKKNADDELELIARNTQLFTPRDFDYSPYFDIIKHPFIEFADYAMYRHLPWNRDGLVSHDRAGVSSIHHRDHLDKHLDREINFTLQRFKDGIKKKLKSKKKKSRDLIIDSEIHSTIKKQNKKSTEIPKIDNLQSSSGETSEKGKAFDE